MELAGGGWYGGGAAGNYNSSSRTRAAGGGGGSGYVFTSSASKPSGYLVDLKYYMDNAGTYSSGTTGFVNNPNTNGNGYARITLTSATRETSSFHVVGVEQWINIEKQFENGRLTGSFNYDGYTITETDVYGDVTVHSN